MSCDPLNEDVAQLCQLCNWARMAHLAHLPASPTGLLKLQRGASDNGRVGGNPRPLRGRTRRANGGLSLRRKSGPAMQMQIAGKLEMTPSTLQTRYVCR